jgi:hypothetical protein
MPIPLIKTPYNFYRWLQIEIQDTMPIIKVSKEGCNKDC